MSQTMSIAVAETPQLRDPRSKVSWFTAPVLIPLAVLPALIIIATPYEYLAGSLLAYVNCLIAGAAMVHFVRQHTLEGLVPVLMLIAPVLAWPVASIYFAIFDPQISYRLIFGTPVRNLSHGVRLQSVFMLFLISYLVPALLLIRRPAATSQMTINRRRGTWVGTAITCMGMVALTTNALSKVMTFPPWLVYIADGMFLYLNGLFLVVGAYFGHLPRTIRILAVAFMIAIGFFYTLGNARGMAVTPMVLFLVGLLFCSDIKQKWKLMVVLGLAFAGPMYLLFGETTRAILGRGGFTNLAYRYQTLSRWREVGRPADALSAAFGRLFFTGGHAIVTQTPEKYDYIPFSLEKYVIEAITRLAPGKLYYEPYYSTNAHLLRYGFRISKTSSVEISMVGSLWILGGPFFLVAGGIASALLHACAALILRRAGRASPHKAIFYMAMIGPVLLTWTGQDLITQFRTLVWHLLAGIVLYYMVLFWLVAGEKEDTAVSPYQQDMVVDASWRT